MTISECFTPRVGDPHCPVSGEAVSPQSRERIIKAVQNATRKRQSLIVLAPYAKAKKAEFKEDFQDLFRKGYTRARVDGNIVDLGDEISLDGNVAHDVDVVIDSLAVKLRTIHASLKRSPGSQPGQRHMSIYEC